MLIEQLRLPGYPDDMLVNCRDYWSDIDLITAANKWLTVEHGEEEEAKRAARLEAIGDQYLYDLCESVVVSSHLSLCL